MHNIWADMAPISRNETLSLLKKSPLGTRNDYVAKNELTTYICVNTWLLIIKKWSPLGFLAVRRAILEHGLPLIIQRASDTADDLVHEREVEDALFRSILNDVEINFPRIFSHTSETNLIGFDLLATKLCLLRYPKRYTPIDSDVLYKKSLSEFVENDRRLRVLQQEEFPSWLIEPMREYINSLNWDYVLQNVNYNDIVLSPGITLDARASVGSKLLALAKDTPEVFIEPFGIPLVASRPSVERSYYGRNNLLEKRVTKAIPVPKSYKASRIIFPETVSRQSKAKQVFNLIQRILPKDIPLDHQENNQELCRIKGFATIDWSKASDSIAKTLLWELFPYPVAQLLDSMLPTHYVIDGKERLLHGVATSGNALTFILESIIFWALARVSVDYAILYLDSKNDIISIYGDDVVLPDEAAEICCQFGILLGFLPNSEKTFFGDSNYRESCGKEYYKGVDTSCVYFPRSPIEGTLKPLTLSLKPRRQGWPVVSYNDSTQALISLQHQLYSVCYEASVFVAEIIRECHPRMTSSVANTNSFDIWDYEDTRIRRGVPAGEVIHDKWNKPIRIRRYEISSDDLYRECKYGCKIKSLPAERHYDWEVIYDLYKYQSFLMHGPSYESPLMELLGVTQRPMSYDDAFGEKKGNWGYISI